VRRSEETSGAGKGKREGGKNRPLYQSSLGVQKDEALALALAAVAGGRERERKKRGLHQREKENRIPSSRAIRVAGREEKSPEGARSIRAEEEKKKERHVTFRRRQ